jgi:hypothetical protein
MIMFTNKNFYVFQEKLKKVPGFKPSRCNNMIKMESQKVVDTLDIEDMGDKASFIIDNLISGLIYDINEVFR